MAADAKLSRLERRSFVKMFVPSHRGSLLPIGFAALSVAGDRLVAKVDANVRYGAVESVKCLVAIVE